MKNVIMKMCLATLCMVVLLSGIWVSAAGYVMLYAEDGRSKEFPESQVEAQLTVGWYREPVTRMYALDGRSKVYAKSRVEEQKKVGWYDGKPVKMYAEDGRTKYVGSNEVAANEKVGWYTEPMQRLYAEGRSKLFPKSQVTAQLEVGWYTEPVQRLYAEGRSKLFPESKVAEQLQVGWYTEPVQRLYAPGRSKLFKESEVMAQLQVGWYLDENLTPVKFADVQVIVGVMEQIRSGLDYYSIAANNLDDYINDGKNYYLETFFECLGLSYVEIWNAYEVSLEYDNLYDIASGLEIILNEKYYALYGEYSLFELPTIVGNIFQYYEDLISYIYDKFSYETV